MTCRTTTASVAALLSAAVVLRAQSGSIVVQKGVEARMRDGVVLRADVYRPDTTARLPALVERTPYSKNPGNQDNIFRRLASRGFVVIVQDTRGRYTSDGVARPHDEGEGGYDTIEWAAQLPYVNGRVGTFGGSYSATTQLLAAPAAAAAPFGHLPVVFVQQPLRHCVSGRRLLSCRRAIVESRAGCRRQAP
jgi:predicted acyl esterase